MPDVPPHLNLLRAMVRGAGKTETPGKFIYWASITALAATLQRNVWMVHYEWSKIYPNLYTFLLGPGAVGKGAALNLANVYVQRSVMQGAFTHVFRGRVNYSSLIDEMLPAADGEPCRPLFLISPELSDTVGKGEFAKRFVQTMTNLYEGHEFTPLSERTRGHGKTTLISPCVTWLAGTTEAGFRECIDLDDFENGFMGRVCPVPVDEYSKERISRPDTSAFHTHYGYVVERLAHLSQHYYGQLEFSDQAYTRWDNWYMKRPAAQYRSIDTLWQRLPVLVRKLAMIHHMAELPVTADPKGEEWKIIQPAILGRAIRDAEDLLPGAARFTEKSIGRAYNPILFNVAEYIFKHKQVYQKELTVRYKKQGLQEALDELLRYGLIVRKTHRRVSGHQAHIIEWVADVPAGQGWESVIFDRIGRSIMEEQGQC